MGSGWYIRVLFAAPPSRGGSSELLSRTPAFEMVCALAACHSFIHAIPYHTIPYHTILYSTLLYSTILYYTLLYSTIHYYTLLYYTGPSRAQKLVFMQTVCPDICNLAIPRTNIRACHFAYTFSILRVFTRRQIQKPSTLSGCAWLRI